MIFQVIKCTCCSCDCRLERSASSWAESWRADCSISSRRETSMGIEFPMGVGDIKMNEACEYG